MSKITGNEPSAASDYIITDSLGNIEGIDQKSWTGLTIRQHFAAMAMQGMMASWNSVSMPDKISIEAAAEVSVEMADTLIAELNKQKSTPK